MEEGMDKLFSDKELRDIADKMYLTPLIRLGDLGRIRLPQFPGGVSRPPGGKAVPWRPVEAWKRQEKPPGEAAPWCPNEPIPNLALARTIL